MAIIEVLGPKSVSAIIIIRPFGYVLVTQIFYDCLTKTKRFMTAISATTYRQSNHSELTMGNFPNYEANTCRRVHFSRCVNNSKVDPSILKCNHCSFHACLETEGKSVDNEGGGAFVLCLSSPYASKAVVENAVWLQSGRPRTDQTYYNHFILCMHT